VSDLITTAEAAKLTGRPRGTIGFWIRRGELSTHGATTPANGGKGATLISRAEVLALADARPQRGTPRTPPRWPSGEDTACEASPEQALQWFRGGLVTELRAASLIAGQQLYPSEWHDLKRILRLSDDTDVSEAA
jgi:hypothetical protein